jgi:hypothetical protein
VIPMSKADRIERPVRAVESSAQMSLFRPRSRTPGTRSSTENPGFEDPDPRDIFLGDQRLDRYLKAMGLGWVPRARDFLRSLDWSRFESRYSPDGRRPYAPASMMGLVLYGTLLGRSSLRELEVLARTDLGAIWMVGGICPDHSVIGRFLQLHAETLTDAFFEEMTRGVLRALGRTPKVMAGDGSIVESAASRFRTVKLEAAERLAEASRAEAESHPTDIMARRRAEEAERIAQAARARAKVRKRRGDKADATQVNTRDPEAGVLKTKRGHVAPGYVPSILASEDQIILGQRVEPTSELAAVEPLLDQASRVTDDETKTLLLDANYFRSPVVNAALDRDLDLLCPDRSQSPNSKPSKYFRKTEFHYEPSRDSYICPGGKELRPCGSGCDHRTKERYTQYRAPTKACRNCPLRDQCTRTKRPRRIRRYLSDDAKDALRGIMEKPSAKKLFLRRQVMVEPVFGQMKGVQGLRRFRRFGLKGVRLEFALHAAAHNLRKLLALESGLGPGMRRVLCALLRLPKRLLASLVAGYRSGVHGPAGCSQRPSLA